MLKAMHGGETQQLDDPTPLFKRLQRSLPHLHYRNSASSSRRRRHDSDFPDIFAPITSASGHFRGSTLFAIKIMYGRESPATGRSNYGIYTVANFASSSRRRRYDSGFTDSSGSEDFCIQPISALQESDVSDVPPRLHEPLLRDQSTLRDRFPTPDSSMSGLRDYRGPFWRQQRYGCCLVRTLQLQCDGNMGGRLCAGGPVLASAAVAV